MWFLEELQVPARRAGDETVWKRPTYSSLYQILIHPACGGAYVYGRTQVVLDRSDGTPRKRVRSRTKGNWIALLPNSHSGYIGWEEFERGQERIRQNGARGKHATASRRGTALLTGLLRCGRCGQKLTVHYIGRGHDMLR